jgi:hypothetical protein
MSEPRRLDFVSGEFAPHNLPLQALLGLLGFGARVEPLLAALPSGDAPHGEVAEHPLDLALLGLLGLDASLRAGLRARGLAPCEGNTPATPSEPSEAHAPEPSASAPSSRVAPHSLPPLRELLR